MLEAIALSALIWAHPGASPCGPVGSDANPCWNAPRIPDHIYAARFAGDWTPGKICDGDVIENSGAQDGVAFVTGRQTAAFDRDYLDAMGLEYTVRHARVCIPARDYGDGWLEPIACGNAVRVISRGMLPSIAASVAGGLSRGNVTHSGTNVTHSGGGFHGGVTHRHGPQVPQVPVPQPVALLLGALAMLGGLAIGKNERR